MSGKTLSPILKLVFASTGKRPSVKKSKRTRIMKGLSGKNMIEQTVGAKGVK